MIWSSCFYKLLNVGSRSRPERTVPPCRGVRAPKGRRGLTPTGTALDASTDNINESGKREKSYSRAWETSPALRATSPARRRSFASGRTNSQGLSEKFHKRRIGDAAFLLHILSDKLSFRNAQIYSVLSIIVKFPNWEQFPYLRLPFACGFKRGAKKGGLCFKHRLQMNSSGSRRALKC